MCRTEPDFAHLQDICEAQIVAASLPYDPQSSSGHPIERHHYQKETSSNHRRRKLLLVVHGAQAIIAKLEPHRCPADVQNQALFDTLTENSKLYQFIEQNARQAVALLGTPEHPTIVRIGKFLVSCAFAFPSTQSGVAEFFQSQSAHSRFPIFQVVLGLLTHYFSPAQVGGSSLTELIALLRCIVIPSAVSSKRARYRDALFELCAMINYMLALWFGENQFLTMHPEQLLGKDVLDGAPGSLSHQRELSKTGHRPIGHLPLASFWPSSPRLIELPHELLDFFLHSQYRKSCKRCSALVLCLHCGSQCCESNACSNSPSTHAESYYLVRVIVVSNAQILRCMVSFGMFLIPKRSEMIILQVPSGRVLDLPSPYVDRHGQSDLGFRFASHG